jgi:hypothetical protein
VTWSVLKTLSWRKNVHALRDVPSQAGDFEMAKKRKAKRRYSPSASEDVEKEVRSYKRGTARSGPGGRGGKVKSRKQAIAIGLSRARAEGKKVPKKRSAKKRSAKKRK